MDTDKLDPNDEPTIMRVFNKLINEADKERRIFSKLLLTIYTPVTSGLFFLSTSVSLDTNYEKFSFFIIILTAALIVLSALLENLFYFLIIRESAEVYTKHARETGKHLVGPFGGKAWQSKFIEIQTFVMTALLFVNLISVLFFVYLNII